MTCIMRVGLVIGALAIGLPGTGAEASDYGVLVRSHPERAIARVTTQGLGYSVLRQDAAPVNRTNRVLAVCAIDETFARATCPTPRYDAYCPSARIVCR